MQIPLQHPGYFIYQDDAGLTDYSFRKIMDETPRMTGCAGLLHLSGLFRKTANKKACKTHKKRINYRQNITGRRIF